MSPNNRRGGSTPIYPVPRIPGGYAPRVQTDPGNLREPPRRLEQPSVPRIRANEIPGTFHINDPLNGENWTVWRERMMPMLQVCGLEGYISGRTKRPDPTEDPAGADNWDSNNAFARCLIVNNITDPEMAHVVGCTNAHEIWQKLEAAHGRQGHQRSVVTLARNLRLASAAKKPVDDFCEHLDKLEQQYQMGIDLKGVDDPKISDVFFKSMITASLPKDWDEFATPYVHGPESPHQFIRILKEEHLHRETRKRQGIERAELENNRFKFQNVPLAK
jgi:gag-polypeptide of LTR copia-type